MNYIANPAVKIVKFKDTCSEVKLKINIDYGNELATYTTILKNYKKLDSASGNIDIRLGTMKELAGSIFDITTTVTDLNPNVNKVTISVELKGAVDISIPVKSIDNVEDGDVVTFPITIIFQIQNS
ncbi:MAG: hypothetical protein ISS16_07050 [Ignavibacteria bacterium]|nr:hypothetical protein [Ignavibacteria bacterium]